MKAAAVRWPRRFTRGLWAHFLCGMLMPFAFAAPPETKLTTAQIRATVGGHHVTDGRPAVLGSCARSAGVATVITASSVEP